MLAQSIDETRLETTGLILRTDIMGDKSDPRLPIIFWKLEHTTHLELDATGHV
jgi:hypothetical protein